MSFNKNTWDKDYTGSKGLKKLSEADAMRKGFAPRKSNKKKEEKKNGK